MNDDEKKLVTEIAALTAKLNQLYNVYYATHSIDKDVFQNPVIFMSKVKIRRVAVDPAIAEQDEIVSVSGKLKICTTSSTPSSAAVWTTVGTQT